MKHCGGLFGAICGLAVVVSMIVFVLAGCGVQDSIPVPVPPATDTLAPLPDR